MELLRERRLVSNRKSCRPSAARQSRITVRLVSETRRLLSGVSLFIYSLVRKQHVLKRSTAPARRSQNRLMGEAGAGAGGEKKMILLPNQEVR